MEELILLVSEYPELYNTVNKYIYKQGLNQLKLDLFVCVKKLFISVTCLIS